MNEARVPQNNKDWQAMDIYLFSNGQHNSPPRKYHLQTEELQFWQATLHHLARSQYGPVHSNIELYTLDGKRVESPLELIDAASYVAVAPPDVFIPGGYEQYLIKASRSWERRQEKLINTVNSPIEMEIKKEQSKIVADESRIIEATIRNTPSTIAKDQDSIGTNNTIISQLRKENERSLDEKPPTIKPFPNRKSVDIEKGRSSRKTTPQNSKTNSKDEPLSKKRNISLLKSSKQVPNRRQSLKNDTYINKTVNSNKGSKEKLSPSIIKTTEDTVIKDTIILSKADDFHENQSRDPSRSGFDKGIIVISDVYKNPESEVQSVFIDADRKNATRDYVAKEKYKTSDLQKIVEMEELENTKTSKATSIQSVSYFNRIGPDITSSFVSKPKVFNIKLNIELRDHRNFAVDGKSGHLMKCKSATELFIADQESQANIDINLNCDKHVDHLCRKSMLSEKTYSYFCDLNDPKVTMVKRGLDTNCNSTAGRGKENYMLFVPAVLVNENMEWCNPKINQDRVKDQAKEIAKRRSIVTTDVIDIKSNPVSRENSQVTIKHKVSISPNSPIKISAEIPSMLDKDFTDSTSRPAPSQESIKILIKEDKYTQTDWCNVLLQAHSQGNGLSSFHLPPLRTLAQYNLL